MCRFHDNGEEQDRSKKLRALDISLFFLFFLLISVELSFCLQSKEELRISKSSVLQSVSILKAA